MIPFKTKLREMLQQRGICLRQFCWDTGLAHQSFFYRECKHRRATYMAIAYYLEMSVEELIEGTDAEKDWYGDWGQ